MCGRFFLDVDFKRVMEEYKWLLALDEPDGYAQGEVFPSQAVLTIGREGARTMKWGMKFPFMNKLLINGRSETIHEKKLFRSLVKENRVLIPANAYFEWTQEKEKKRISLENEEVISMAGLYRINDQKEHEVVILTKPAEESIQWIHDRMPVILDKAGQEAWLQGDGHEISTNQTVTFVIERSR